MNHPGVNICQLVFKTGKTREHAICVSSSKVWKWKAEKITLTHFFVFCYGDFALTCIHFYGLATL